MKKREYIKDSILIIGILIASLLIFIFQKEVEKLGTLGYVGVMLMCFVSNATVLLPAPGLAVVVSYAQILSPLPVAIAGAIGTSLGELTGYVLGKKATGMSEKVQKCSDFFSKYIKSTKVLVFVLALLPLPLFDIAGLYAGSRNMKPLEFLLFCFSGKALKMLFYATAAIQLLQQILESLS